MRFTPQPTVSGVAMLLGIVMLGAAQMAEGGQSTTAPVGLPQAVSLVDDFQKFGLTAHDQGSRNTCSLFAVTGAANFEFARHNPAAPRLLSEEFLVWAANAATGRQGDQAMFYEATTGLNALGICQSDSMPYASRADSARTPAPEAMADARKLAGCWRTHWIKLWDLTHPLTFAQSDAIKRALATGHPVACGLRWPKGGHDTLTVPRAEDVFDGHSILLAGFADDATQPGGGLFTFRNSAGPKWGRGGYGTMSYAYATAYANDAFWLELGRNGSETPAIRFEAESMTVARSGRAVATTQNMSGYGGPMWSGGRQLLIRSALEGFIELTFANPQAGRYRLRALCTGAPDFGRLGATMDGHEVAETLDLYSGRVCPAGSFELGTHELAAGSHTIRFSIIGKNPGSQGYAFGLDTVDLLPAK